MNINTPGFNHAVESFGLSILDTSGHIDREVLRSIVFNDQDKKIRLESIVHPIVRDLMFGSIAKSTSLYSISLYSLRYILYHGRFMEPNAILEKLNLFYL